MWFNLCGHFHEKKIYLSSDFMRDTRLFDWHDISSCLQRLAVSEASRMFKTSLNNKRLVCLVADLLLCNPWIIMSFHAEWDFKSCDALLDKDNKSFKIDKQTRREVWLIFSKQEKRISLEKYWGQFDKIDSLRSRSGRHKDVLF